MSKIDEYLKAGKTVRIKPTGSSMYPFIIEGRDEVFLKGINSDNVNCDLKKGAVVLYRRNNGMLVLHRIYDINNGWFYMLGDNQVTPEDPLSPKQILGVVIGINKNGRYVSTHNIVYRILSDLWRKLRPVRPIIAKVFAPVKKII